MMQLAFDRKVSLSNREVPSKDPATSEISAGEASARTVKSLIRVRLVEGHDWPAIRVVVRKHHERTLFAHLPFSESKFDALEKRLRAATNECVIVAELKSDLVGVAWVSAGEYLLCDDSLMATTHLIAVDRQRCGPYLSARVFIRLLRALVLWSRSVGAKQTLVHVTTGTDIKSADRILKACGARDIGGNYIV
ncbi:hypothetical protein GCM10007874_50830 [Labrys miyagiensis]|uniref:N-acetyltransferase domain-containing protein n=1 Tax=Labrys miyagiensis TaxID=346912 RepID=A0ABQ6CP09_9HYPH|nr:hypothetical protein [Labrys miyagiensis]GLS22066.1 hypothetical protein GCM10007874_50830 [Labrys miyagiensis]